MLTDGIEPPSPRWNGNNRGALPLSYVSIIQKCLHPLIVFEFCYSLHLCITITAWTKKYYVITKEELSSPIIVKFAVIKPRGGFKPHFCHTRPVVCPSWTSASSATRKHCNCEYRELPPRVISSVSNLHIHIKDWRSIEVLFWKIRTCSCCKHSI